MMYQSKRHHKKTPLLGYLFLLIILIVFLSTIGIKILTGSVLFLFDITSYFKNDSKLNSNQNLDIFLTPQITDIVLATNSASLQFSGTAEKNTTLSIYVNSQKQSEELITDNNFDTKVKLTPDKNTIYLTSKRQSDNQIKKSKNYTVYFFDQPPSLTITSPVDNQKVSSDSIVISGSTDSDTSIKINHQPITTNNNSFSHHISLTEGENKIIIIAADTAGNITEKQITVTYERD